MPEQPIESHLSPAERESLDNRALRQHARAIEELVSMAMATGMTDDRVQAGVDHIRTLDRTASKKLRKGLINAGELLSSLLPQEPQAAEVVQEIVPAEEARLLEDMPADVSSEIDNPTAEKVPDMPENALSARGTRYVNEIFGDNASARLDLSTDDTPAIIDALDAVRGGTMNRSLFTDRLTYLFEGRTDRQITNLTNATSYKTVSVGFANLRKAIQGRDGYSKDGAFVVLSDAIIASREEGQTEEPAEPVTVIESVVERESEPAAEPIVEAAPIEAFPIGVQIERAEILRCLELATETKAVGPQEWLEAGRTFVVAGFERFSDRETAEELWDYIHYHDGLPRREASDGVKSAITIMQPWFFERSKELFAQKPLQEIAARTLFVTIHGYNDIDMVNRNLKQKDRHMTKHVAQRYLVEAIATLIDDRENSRF